MRISTLVPSTPIEVKANTQTTPNVKSTLVDLTVQASWKYADAGAAHDTTSSRVTVTRDGGGFLQTFTVAGRTTATEKTFHNVPAGTYRVSVQSCNDQRRMLGRLAARARRASPRHPGIDAGSPAMRSRSPATPATRPIAWGAPPRILGGRIGTGGAITLVDPTRSIVPACLDASAASGACRCARRLVARPGRPATLTVGWEHPRRWGELHTVSLRLRNGERVVSTLTFDLNAGTVELGRGGAAHGQRARLASGPRRVTLGSGPVRVLLDAGTFRRPARLVRAIRLKLRLVVGRSLAGRRLSVEMAATGDDRAEQAFVAGGAIAVRRG